MRTIREILMVIVMSLLLSWARAATASSPDNPDNNDVKAPCLFANGCTPAQDAAQKSSLPAQATQQIPSSLPRATVSNPPPMAAQEKVHYYLKSTYGPKSFGYSVLGSGISQARDNVTEWGQGAEGYSKRFASSFTQKVVKKTAYFGLTTALHEDPRYFRSGQSGVFQRSFYAAEQVFIAHKDSGGTRVGFSNLITTFGSSYASRQWFPDSYHTWGDYLTNFAISLGIDAGKNAFNEFWPDVKRMLHH
jgi:hypothetical protein